MNILRKRKKIKKMIIKADNIFIMGHKNLDLDALGSSLALSELITKKGRTNYIIIDDTTNELSVEKILNNIDKNINIITSKDIHKYLTANSLLVVLDTNKKLLVQDEDCLDLFPNKIIIDHHNEDAETIKDCLTIIDNTASSTCEMITELIAYENIYLTPLTATLLLSGIVLDTNNFALKTTAKTYYAAALLVDLGADPRQVQYFLKHDIEDYKERQKVIINAEIVNKNIAISKGSKNLVYRKEELAKIADTLLLFNNIEASFVICYLDKKVVGISARSMGTIDVSKIMEPFGGGGNSYEAAAKIENTNLDEVEKQIIEVIKSYK